MKRKNIKAKAWIAAASAIVVSLIVLNGCVESKKIADKSGAQLWAENCQRCHNTPSPASFSHAQWVTCLHSSPIL